MHTRYILFLQRNVDEWLLNIPIVNVFHKQLSRFTKSNGFKRSPPTQPSLHQVKYNVLCIPVLF
jgi:hypothetical protein